MKIQYASDLHLEFPENKKFLLENPLIPVADILVLAGDIVPFAIMDQHEDFFRFLSAHYKATYWVPGNHEFYGTDIALKGGKIQENILSNVHLVNNVSVFINDVKFLFTTLWSTIRPGNQYQIEHSISDFSQIRNKGFRFSAKAFNDQHIASKEFLIRELKQPFPKNVVVTHHVPTLLNYPEQYNGDDLTDAFAVEFFDLIKESTVNAWIFGHHHVNVGAFTIGNTAMVTNQMGYVRYGEQDGFNTNANIVIDSGDNQNNKVIFAQ